jgi:hypothetical protein
MGRDIMPVQSVSSNLLYAAAPVAAGLGAALSSAEPYVSSSGLMLTGRSAKLARGLKAGAMFALALGIVNLVSKAHQKLTQKSPKMQEFEQKHPLASIAGVVAASYAAIVGGSKLVDKIKFPMPQKALPAILKAQETVNNSSILNAVAKHTDKIPAALKQAGKSALGFAPLALLIGAAATSVNKKS